MSRIKGTRLRVRTIPFIEGPTRAPRVKRAALELAFEIAGHILGPALELAEHVKGDPECAALRPLARRVLELADGRAPRRAAEPRRERRRKPRVLTRRSA